MPLGPNPLPFNYTFNIVTEPDIPTDKNLILTACKLRCGLAMTPTGYPASADEKINNIHLNFALTECVTYNNERPEWEKTALY